MEILVIGETKNTVECQQKFGDTHTYHTATSYDEAQKYIGQVQIVFDFLTVSHSEKIDWYENYRGTVFFNTVQTTLSKLIGANSIAATTFGFCGLPTFLLREVLEVSLCQNNDRIKLEEVCARLNTKFAVVKDQPGMVTPRVIGMIINEAYFAIESDIASRADIDLAMKLGTNYPFGPFEWSEKIGIKNVYALLKAVYENTRDERYKICALLEKEAQNS